MAPTRVSPVASHETRGNGATGRSHLITPERNSMLDTQLLDAAALESVIWTIADGRGTDDDANDLKANELRALFIIDRLIGDAEEDLESVRRIKGDERDQIVADFLETLNGLQAARAILRPVPVAVRRRYDDADEIGDVEELEPGEVQLQASWSAGQVVVWASGRGCTPENNEELANRLETIGGPPLGWQLHPDVTLPGGAKAEALAIPLKDALGWLSAVGGGQLSGGTGASVEWLGHVVLEGVRLAARGAIVPTLNLSKRREGRHVESSVKWIPALTNDPTITALAAAMPGSVGVLNGANGRSVVNAVLASVVEAIVAASIERMELPAVPPSANSLTDLSDTIIASMDGRPFKTAIGLASDLSRKMERWANPVMSASRPRMIVQLAPPAEGGVWLIATYVPGENNELMPVDTALKTERPGGPLFREWERLRRVFAALDRAGVRHRGQVALSQDEAWEFMTETGPMLAGIGFDVRVPALSRRKATPSLRLFAEAPSGSVVGAHQLSAVSWSVLFDDVELTAGEVARLAKQARPLVQSHGKWVEVDRADLEKAAAALAERADVTQMSGAEILRQSIGLEGSGLSGGVVVHGDSWASDIVRKAGESTTEAVAHPEGFQGELRSYQAEALGWLGFLDAAGLGGCLALDMGLGKTPTVLAHLARTAGNGPVLVVAPAAVVGNWAAEAARFAPGLRVRVHHGAARATVKELEAEIAKADVLITTYATAVRDIDALVKTQWNRVVLDEAQAIKNPTNETSQQLRRIPSTSRIALTGTPIENGLGDLWAILDYTNPGLVGTRPEFIAQMSGDGEAALRALNGILIFRRTKTEPGVASELPDKIDELDHCTMTTEQIGLYQAVLDQLIVDMSGAESLGEKKQGAVLAAITALKQICNHPAAYRDDGLPLTGRSGKLARLEELVESVFAADERILIFTHFASWGRRLADHLTSVTGVPISCYDGSLARGVRDKLVAEFQAGTGAGALVLSLKAGGTGLNLTSANHVVLYDRWWNPAVEDQARDRAWRIGQSKTVISHRLVCPGTVDEKVEEVVAGKRHIANLVLPASSSLADLSTDQLQIALGLRPDELLTEDD